MKLKKITWVDISGNDEDGAWMTIDEAKAWARKKMKEKISTSGHILHEDKNYVLIAATYDPSKETVSDIVVIPRGIIKKIETLK